jgi:hypothetical protein
MNLRSLLSSQNSGGIGPDRRVCDTWKFAGKQNKVSGRVRSKKRDVCGSLFIIPNSLPSKPSSDGSVPVSSLSFTMKLTVIRLEQIRRS